MCEWAGVSDLAWAQSFTSSLPFTDPWEQIVCSSQQLFKQ